MIPMGILVTDITLIYLLNLMSIPNEISITVLIIFRTLHIGLSVIIGFLSINYICN